MSPSYVAGAPEQLSPELLDVAWGPSLSGSQELVVNLGRDFKSASKVLDGTLSIFFKDASGARQAAGEMQALELSAFEPNGAGKYFDGWVKTGIFSLEGKEGSASVCDGTLWRHVFKGNAGNVTVIANVADGESLLEEVKGKTGWSMMSLKSSSCIAMQTKASLKTEGGEDAGATLVRVHSVIDPEPAEDYQFKLKADVETKAEDGKVLKRAILSWYNLDFGSGHNDLAALTWNCHAGEWTGPEEGDIRQGWIPLLSTDWAEEIPEQD